MRFRQQGQTSYSLGLEPVGNQIEQRCTSLFGSGCEGGSQKSFVVEPDGFAVIELEDAVFPHHVGGLNLGVPPSRVRMQVRQALLHQAKKKTARHPIGSPWPVSGRFH